MNLALSKETADLLFSMAAEDEMSIEELLSALVKKEDRSRHVERRPFAEEDRIQCHRELCFETLSRSTAHDAEEG